MYDLIVYDLDYGGHFISQRRNNADVATFRLPLPLSFPKLLRKGHLGHKALANLAESTLAIATLPPRLLQGCRTVHVINSSYSAELTIGGLANNKMILYVLHPPSYDSPPFRFSIRTPNVRYFTMSKRIARHLVRLGISKERITVALPPIEVVDARSTSAHPEKEPTRSDKLRLLYIGSLNRQRLDWSLLHALRNAHDQVKRRLDILIVASPLDEPSTRSAFLQEVKRNDLQNTVRTIAKKLTEEEKRKLHAWADFFVYPARPEYIVPCEPPLCVLEALADGCPVIAYNASSCDEVICDYANGFLLPNGRPGRLFDVLQDSIDAPDSLLTLRKKCLGTSKNMFDLSRTLKILSMRWAEPNT